MTDDLTVSLTVTHRVTRDGDPPDLTYFDDLALKQVYTLIGQDAADEGITTDDRGYVYGYSKERAVLHLSGPIPDQTPREGSVQGTTSWQLTADTHGAVGVDNTGWELRTDGDFDASGFTLSPSGLLSIDPQHARFSAIPTGGSQAFWLEIRGKDADGVLSTPGKTGPWTVIKVTVAGPDPTISITNQSRTISGSDTDAQEFTLADATNSAPGAVYTLGDVSGVDDTLTITNGVLSWPTSALRASASYLALNYNETITQTAYVGVTSDIGSGTIAIALTVRKPGTLTVTDQSRNVFSTSPNDPHIYNLDLALSDATGAVYTFNDPTAAAAAGASIDGSTLSWTKTPLLASAEWIALPVNSSILQTVSVHVEANAGMGDFDVRLRVNKPVPATVQDISITVDSDTIEAPQFDLDQQTDSPAGAVYTVSDAGSYSTPTISNNILTYPIDGLLLSAAFAALATGETLSQTATIQVAADSGTDTFDVTINVVKVFADLVTTNQTQTVFSTTAGPLSLDLGVAVNLPDDATYTLTNTTGVYDTPTISGSTLTWPLTAAYASAAFTALSPGGSIAQTVTVQAVTPGGTDTFTWTLNLTKAGSYTVTPAVDPWISESRPAVVLGPEAFNPSALVLPTLLNTMEMTNPPVIAGADPDRSGYTYREGYYREDIDNGVISTINPPGTVWQLGQPFSHKHPSREGDWILAWPPNAGSDGKLNNAGQTNVDASTPGEYRFTVTSDTINGPLITIDRTGATEDLDLRDVYCGKVADYADWQAGKRWRDELIDYIKEGDILRWMAWGQPMSTWARKASNIVDYAHYTLNHPDGNPRPEADGSPPESDYAAMAYGGPCYEGMIDLAARANRHVWLNMFHMIDIIDVDDPTAKFGDIRNTEAYRNATTPEKIVLVRALARASVPSILAGEQKRLWAHKIADYCVAHSFPSNKAIYIEHGNETWNGILFGWQDAVLEGIQQGLLDLGKDMSLREVHGYLTALLGDIMRDVFRERGLTNEIRIVVGSKQDKNIEAEYQARKAEIDALTDLPAFAAWVGARDNTDIGANESTQRLDGVDLYLADYDNGATGLAKSDFYVSVAAYLRGFQNITNQGLSWLGTFATQAEHDAAANVMFNDTTNPGYTQPGEWLIKNMTDWVTGKRPQRQNVAWVLWEWGIHRDNVVARGYNFGPGYEGNNHEIISNKTPWGDEPDLTAAATSFAIGAGGAAMFKAFHDNVMAAVGASDASSALFGGFREAYPPQQPWRVRYEYDLNNGDPWNTMLLDIVAEVPV